MDVRRHAHGDGETRKDRVALAVPECTVHRRREEREAEAGDRAEERQGGERCDRTGVSGTFGDETMEAYLTQRRRRTRQERMS